MLSSLGLSSFVIVALVTIHLVVAPYTKVEESFNIQAIHDVVYYGAPVGNSSLKLKALFDHMTFAGSVPRTFIGALVIAGLSKPLIWLGAFNGLKAQLTARLVLGLLNAGALVNYVRAIKRAYGNRTAMWYTFLQASQFHVFFYTSRTLPNMFAFCLSTFALPSFLPSPIAFFNDRITHLRRGFYLLTTAAVIFRSEIALLIAVHVGNELLKTPSVVHAVTLVRRVFIPSVLIAGIASLIISVPIDTFFWQSQRLLWPELSAFFFNIFPEDHEGASAWGTSPWHWYFTSAIPRLIPGSSLLLIPYGLLFTSQRRSIINALLPTLGYTTIYSILAHKETRFLFPIIPSLTLATALPASYLSQRKSKVARLLTTLLALSIALTAFISHAVLLPLSAQSYPGAHALKALHTHHHHQTYDQATTPQQVHVHLTNLALQSGVTRFLEQSGSELWVYDKSPNTTTQGFWSRFDYLVLEPAELPLPDSAPGFTVVTSISGLRRQGPRVLRPSEGRGCLVLCHNDSDSKDGLHELLNLLYGRWVAWLYGVVHDVLREGVGVGVAGGLTRGYWLDWGVEERLLVLEQSLG